MKTILLLTTLLLATASTYKLVSNERVTDSRRVVWTTAIYQSATNYSVIFLTKFGHRSLEIQCDGYTPTNIIVYGTNYTGKITMFK